MTHYHKDTKPFIIQCAIFLFVFVFCLILLLGFLLMPRYPQANMLAYEECTFIFYERKSVGRSNYQYHIFVEEYEAPIVIDNIARKGTNELILKSLKRGELLHVSIEDKENLDLYEISAHGEYILSYEDYLIKHRNNDRVGIIFGVVGAITSVTFLIIGVVYYKKTGNCLKGF